MIIKKKIIPKYFKMIKEGKKTIEIRLNDFEANPGDILCLEEVNPKTKELTGNKISKEVGNVYSVNPLDFYTIEDLKKKGLKILEFKQ